MSYAGVESEEEYMRRRLAEIDQIRYEQSYGGRAEAARKERDRKAAQLASLRARLPGIAEAAARETARVERLIAGLEAELGA